MPVYWVIFAPCLFFFFLPFFTCKMVCFVLNYNIKLCNFNSSSHICSLTTKKKKLWSISPWIQWLYNKLNIWIVRISTGCVEATPPPYIGYSANISVDVSSYTGNNTPGNVGESRNFTCPQGTVALGKEIITCLANGQWETPRCQGKS